MPTDWKRPGRPPTGKAPHPRINLSLAPQAAEKLRRLSDDTGVPMSQIVSKLVLEMPE
jgi:hypothetical protein